MFKIRSILFVSLIFFIGCGGGDEGDSGSTTTASISPLDSSFSGDGIVISHNAAGGNNLDQANAITVDASGNIYAAGKSDKNATSHSMIVWKYLSDGSLDTSFNYNGIYVDPGEYNSTSHLITSKSEAKGIASDSSGNVYVTGFRYNLVTCTDMLVWKFTPSGILDSSFGVNGEAKYTTSNCDSEYGNAIAVDDSGSVYVTGSVNVNKDMAIWKFNANGTLDTSFNRNGLATYTLGTTDKGLSIAVNSSHDIFVSGYTEINGSKALALWKYNITGDMNYSFSIDLDRGGSNDDIGNAVALASDGSIYVAGSFDESASKKGMAIVKLISTGTLDTSFNGNGTVTYTSNGYFDDVAYAVVVDTNNDVYVAGVSNWDMSILKYSNSGQLDTSFDGDGIFTHNSAGGGDGEDVAYGLFLNSSGSLFMTGKSLGTYPDQYGNAGYDMAIWKY